MERHRTYKLGLAVLVCAMYCRGPMGANCERLQADASGSSVNGTSHRISAREYFVYYQGVQGRPGVDFPVFSRIPRTGFSCKDVESGYYADLETDCQVFHICNEGAKVSFLCPNGTIFQQADLICDWWFKVNCTSAPSLYEESAEQLRDATVRRKAARRVVVGGAEAQVAQESASLVGGFTRMMTTAATTANPHPNHRATYSDIQDPTTYYTTRAHAPHALNNGRPFVVAAPKLGAYATEPPAAGAHNYITPLPSATTTRRYASTYGERIRLANARAAHAGGPQVDGSRRKPKKKTAFTIGLSSAQGAVAIKTTQARSEGKRKAKVRLDLGGLQAPPPSDNEIATPAGGFYVTKSSTVAPGEPATSEFNAGSATGAKNTYIPTSRRASTPPTASYDTTTLAYVSNTFGFVKPTGMPKPRPFEPTGAATTARPAAATTTSATTTAVVVEATGQPNYQLSSASPFATQPPLAPRERPGLAVPPSVGPQTLHTLAVYFANALDSLAEEANATAPPTSATEPAPTTPPADKRENALISSLLSPHTVDKYAELFMLMARGEMPPQQDDDGDDGGDDREDLQREHSNNAVQSPRARQLAKVFSQALSSYLDDPERFKKVLHQVRPTEPPIGAGAAAAALSNDEDELLNFSDADIKPENPRLPTLAPPNPTWGYILAYNSSSTTADYRATNHIDPSDEHLESADSQSLIPALSAEIHAKAAGTDLPSNHWTASPDATKLWRSALYVNPFAINQNFDATEALLATSTEEAGETGEADAEEYDGGSTLPTERYVDYELRSLPQLTLNASSVHGLLIDYMNSSRHDESGRLRRILNKLNTTEDEFLARMKQIERNPLTKRLILLLVSECGGGTDARTHAVRDIISLAKRGEHAAPPPETTPLRPLVDSDALGDGDQDGRAIQLLNSLYSIASKYGK